MRSHYGDSSHVTKYNVYIPFNSSNLIAKLGAGQCRVSVQYRTVAVQAVQDSTGSTGQYSAPTMTATSTVSLLCLLVLELELDVIASLCLSFSLRLLWRVYIRIHQL